MDRLAPSNGDDALYETSPSTLMRVFAVAYAALALWLFVLARDDEGVLQVVTLWARSGWWIRAGIVIGYVAIPGALLESFIEKVVFGAKTIRRRDKLGRWRSFSYDEVESVEVDPEEKLRIRFTGGRKFDVFASVGDLDRVQAIVRSRMSGHTPTPTE